MPVYAQLDLTNDRIVVSVTRTRDEVSAPNMIPISEYDETLLLKKHDEKTGKFVDWAVSQAG